jgi:Tfp pilus assembly protein FimV
VHSAPKPEQALEAELFQESAPASNDALSAATEENLNAGSLKDHVHIDFDLDLPEMEEPLPSAPSQVPTSEDNTTALDANPLTNTSAPAEENPLQVRFDLAQELWQVGQHHTARAIVEEVLRQANGALLEQCQAWLNERQ